MRKSRQVHDDVKIHFVCTHTNTPYIEPEYGGEPYKHKMEVVDTIYDNFTLSEDINGPLLAAVIGVDMVAGLVTNSFVLILTLCYLKAWKRPSDIFLTNMLLNNLIIVIFVLPFPIITCASGEWIFGSTWSQKAIVCQFATYLFTYSFGVTTESLVLVSFDRFFFIVKALQYEKYMTSNKAVIIVAVSWILAAILCSTPLYGLGKFEFDSSNGNCVSIIENEVGFSVYFSVVFSSFIISIIVTSAWTYCYTRKYLKKRNGRRKYKDSMYISQRRRLIGLFGTLIIIHILCYSLVIAAAIIGTFIRLPDSFYATAFVTLSIIVILSPLVQAYFRTEVRNFVYSFSVKIIKSCKTKCKSHNTNRNHLIVNPMMVALPPLTTNKLHRVTHLISLV